MPVEFVYQQQASVSSLESSPTDDNCVPRSDIIAGVQNICRLAVFVQSVTRYHWIALGTSMFNSFNRVLVTLILKAYELNR